MAGTEAFELLTRFEGNLNDTQKTASNNVTTIISPADDFIEYRIPLQKYTEEKQFSFYNTKVVVFYGMLPRECKLLIRNVRIQDIK